MIPGADALASYEATLEFLAKGGGASQLPAFLAGAPALAALHRSMAAVAPARPGAHDEEWNPLSQRPHAPLAPEVREELGAEVTALKEAIDAFTTLGHEMMHVALWEPFFTGRWAPKGKAAFRAFSLLAEGFCFFYADIVLTAAVRVRLPDGEFALERATPSSARFAPARAFAALGLRDPAAILDVYLAGFSGNPTALWQSKGKAPLGAALAAQAYDFYTGSLRYLDDVYAAMARCGLFSEFRKRFCKGPSLTSLTPAEDLPSYFRTFFKEGLAEIARRTPAEIDTVRERRARQMRAYYALQVRWFLQNGTVLAKAPFEPKAVLPAVAGYLDALESGQRLRDADKAYERTVRKVLLAHDAWAGERWLIVPRRAGGHVSAFENPPKPLVTATYLIDELTKRLKDSQTAKDRKVLLAEIARVAASKSLRPVLARPAIRPAWSVPLAAFSPATNTFRELAFSYQ